MHAAPLKLRLPTLAIATVALGLSMACTAPPAFLLPAAIMDPNQAGPAGKLQGEYQAPGGAPAAQIIVMDADRFQLRWWPDGLPTSLPAPRQAPSGGTTVDGELDGTVARFSGNLQGVSDGEILTVSDNQGARWTLERHNRRSPTLGLAAPAGAVVLDSEKTTDGLISPEGHLQRGARSREAFGDARIHVEYRLPFEPDGDGQYRGNSGVYIQSRYEVQIVDSFGRPTGDRQAGALYKQTAPLVNAALPPLVWQTYDIDFRAARFDETGKKVANARVTVRHNGVLVQDDTEILGPTGRGDAESPSPGRLLLQDHGNPVIYRNVWIQRYSD